MGKCDVTEMVLQYKEKGDDKLLKEIHRQTKRLVWGVIKSKGMMNWPPILLEEIEEEARSKVLLMSIEKYDPERKAKFETLYTWWCRSYIGAKQRYYQRRANLVFTPSVDQALARSNTILGVGENAENSADYFLQRDYRVFSDVKKQMREIFEVS